MILIPEQLYILRKKIKKLEKQKRENDELMVYNDERNRFGLEAIENYINNTFEQYHTTMDENELSQYKSALKEGEIITKIPTDKIGYGTKFAIEFSLGDIEEYILTENSIGIRSTDFGQQNSYISRKSSFGNAIFGKTTGDNFSYSIKTNDGTITISGKIIEIIERTNDDIHLLTSRPMSKRLAKRKIVVEPIEIKENELTLSQYELLKEEKQRLENALARFNKYNNGIMVGSIITLKDYKNNEKKYKVVDKDGEISKDEIRASSSAAKRIYTKKIGDRLEEFTKFKKDGRTKVIRYFGTLTEIDNSNIEKEDTVYTSIHQIKSKLRKVNKLLETIKIVSPPTTDKIGIGSKVSIMILDKNGKNKFLRVEVINSAHSTEDNYNYIEATSSLGASIIGLKNNERFEFYKDNLEIMEGIVYDIDNCITLQEDLSYQKRS